MLAYLTGYNVLLYTLIGAALYGASCGATKKRMPEDRDLSVKFVELSLCLLLWPWLITSAIFETIIEHLR